MNDSEVFELLTGEYHICSTDAQIMMNTARLHPEGSETVSGVWITWDGSMYNLYPA